MTTPFSQGYSKSGKTASLIYIQCYNQSTIRRVHSKAKHTLRRHNTIKHIISMAANVVDYLRPIDNIVDPLTKELNKELVEKLS